MPISRLKHLLRPLAFWRRRNANEARRAARAWRMSEGLRLALEAGEIGTFEAYLPDGEVLANEKWLEIMGLTGSRPLTVRDFEALIVEEDRARRRVVHAAARGAASGGHFAFQYRIRRANDGALRHIDARARLHFDNGEAIHVQGVNRDITEQVEARTALEEKAGLAEQLSLLATALPGAFYTYVLRPDGSNFLSYASPNIEKLLGFRPEAYRENITALSERVHPEDVKPLFDSVAVSARETAPWMFMFRYRHPQKGEIWIEGHSAPSPRTDENVIWHGYLHDVTDRETAARELAASEARLGALKDEKLAVLERLASSLAHEVNQPLAAGATLLAVARRRLQAGGDADPLRQGVGEALDKAAEQMLRAGQIIARVRQFSRFGEPDKIYCNLHALIGETLAALATDVELKGFTLSSKLAAEQDGVLIDKVQIAEVLINLIHNARQATPREAQQTIVLTTRLEGKNIIASIEDRGSGLSENAKKDMFELFWSSKSSGMGVGLPMSRAIVEAHFGQLWAEANPDGGAIFRFSLPLAEMSEAAESGR